MAYLSTGSTLDTSRLGLGDVVRRSPDSTVAPAPTGGLKFVNALTPGGEWHINANPLTTGGSAPRASSGPAPVGAAPGGAPQTVPTPLPMEWGPAGGAGGWTPGQASTPTITSPGQVPNVYLGDTPQIPGYTLPDAVGVTAPQMGPIERAMATLAEAERARAAQFNTGPQDEIRARQLALMDELERVIAGRAGPSVAELAYQQQADQAARQQMGIASARSTGGNYGLAMREAGINQGNILGQAMQGQALLRAKETADARAGLGVVQNFARESDIDVASKQGDWENAINSLNAQLGTDVSRTNATNLTGTSQFNAGEGNKREYQQAGLNLDADKFTAAEQNTQAYRQGDLTTRISIAQAGNELQKLIEQAKLLQSNGQFNAELNTRIAIETAKLRSEVERFNVGWTNRMGELDDTQTFQAGEGDKNRATQKSIAAAAQLSGAQGSPNSTGSAIGSLLGGLAGAAPLLLGPAGIPIAAVTIPTGAAIGGNVGGNVGATSADEERRRREEELRRLGLL